MKKAKLNLKQIRFFIFSLALLLLVGGTGYWLGLNKAAGSNPVKTIVNRQSLEVRQEIDFSLFWEVWDRLETRFIASDEMDPAQMVYGAIKGMVAALGDPYTAFLSPEENKQTRQDLNGSFEGVGIQIGFKDGFLAVIAPLSGMPAEKVGVRAGDLILKIEDLETTGVSLPEAVRLIRGPKGSAINLTLLHEGEEQPYEASITRETIIVPSVELEFEDEVAWLKLSRFGERTDAEWLKAVEEIVSACENGTHSGCRGVVLDLRNNPGGFLAGSVFIASEFVDSGVIVIQENASGQKENFSVNREGKLLKVPLVILVNQGSASASEILAGALREYNRAKIVGETTFGKGTIQEAEDFEGGSGLHVTTARWLLPSGKSINDEGITPDYEVTDDPETEEKDEQLEKAKEIILK